MKSKILSLQLLIFCAALLVGAGPAQITGQTPASAVNSSDALSYEGQIVSSVELAGRPDLKPDEFMQLVSQHSSETFSSAKVDQSLAALKRTGQFQDVHLDLRPEQDGVRVMFILQPAVYFGMYQFPGAERFAYSRLLQVSNYAAQEPYSPLEIKKSQASLETFFRRNGYFQADVQPEVQTDEPNGLANVTFQVKLNKLAKLGEIVITGTTPEQAGNLKGALWSLRARMLMSAIRPGKKYSLKTLQNSRAYLEGVLNKQGRLAAQVRLTAAAYNAVTNRAEVSFDVKQGPVVNGKVEGAHLWSWTKHKLLPIYQQAGVTPELIQEGGRNLLSHFRQKGFFDVQVETEFQMDSDPQTVVYRIIKGQRKKIEDVAFTGNRNVSEDELLQHVIVSKAGFLSKGKYNEASIKTLTAFYQSRGFNQVKVTPQFASQNDSVVVTFVVDEGPQDIIESVQVEGDVAVSREQFAPYGLRLSPGQPYSQKAIDDDRNQVMAYYLEHGYLTVTFHATAEPSPGDPRKYRVVYNIFEGPQVHANNIVTIGIQRTQQALINKDTVNLQSERPITETDILTSESLLYTRGVFDWAEVRPRRQITSQSREDVVVKVHEARRNALTYGFGFEVTNRGGSVPSGTVAVPGLPAVGISSQFKISQHTYKGPRASILYTRSNVRGKAEIITIGALGGPLIRRLTFTWANPTFRWTKWSSNYSSAGEISRENPIFNSRLAQVSWQLQRSLGQKQNKTFLIRYSLTKTGLTELLIPDLIPEEDRHTRLSTFSGIYIHDTRDNILDALKGRYHSFQLDFNSRLLGSSASFGKVLFQTAYYHPIPGGVIWANSIRIGLEKPFGGSHVPISESFFTGGGSTLRGFPLNGAGPQRTIPACNDPEDPATCSLIRVPVGGSQLLIFNSEFRIPLPLKRGLSLATFYDGGNVFHPIGFDRFRSQYTNTVGLGFRYTTPVGPVRVDIGRNMNKIDGIKATQIFITLGQAF